MSALCKLNLCDLSREHNVPVPWPGVHYKATFNGARLPLHSGSLSPLPTTSEARALDPQELQTGALALDISPSGTPGLSSTGRCFEVTCSPTGLWNLVAGLHVSGTLGELRAGPGAVRRGEDRPENVLSAGSPGLGLEPSRSPVARLQLTPACPWPDFAHHEHLPPLPPATTPPPPGEDAGERTGEGCYSADSLPADSSNHLLTRGTASTPHTPEDKLGPR